MADFYSPWGSVPNGGAKYRSHLHVDVAEQDVSANKTTLNWALTIEKDRSFNGFYGWDASWVAVIDGHTVISGSGVGFGSKPDVPWTGWSAWTMGSGQVVVDNNTDGTLAGLVVSGNYTASHHVWAPGALPLDAGSSPSGTLTMDLPPIARATRPTVSPNPAVVGTSVVIGLPAASGGFTHDLTWEHTTGGGSGTIATGVTGNQTWTVPSGSAPIVITVQTFNGVALIGERTVTLVPRSAPAAPSVLPHDPSKQFDVQLRQVEFVSGGWDSHQTIPAATIQVVDSSSATATCAFSMSKLNAVDYPDYSYVDAFVFDGDDWVYTNHRFVMSRITDDGTDPTETGNFSGIEFIDYELGFAYIQADLFWDGSTDHAAPTTPGAMLTQMIADAKTRGWGPRVSISFDSTKTSLGDPWINTAVSRNFTAGTPISQVLQGLVADGLVEYRTEYHGDAAWLVLLNPGTGSDYSADGASPIVDLSLAKLSRAPRAASSEKRITAVTVAGDNKLTVGRSTTPYDTDVLGRLEGWVAASGVTDATAAGTIGDNALRDNGAATSQRTYEIQAPSATPQFYPYSVFIPGDWVLRPEADDVVKDRISQVTLNKTADNTLAITVGVGDLILSGTATLAKRQAAQTGGSIAGGSQTSQSPLNAQIPAAPVIGTVTSLGYWNLDGAAKSAVTIDWGAVANALNGAAISVALYEVWERPTGIDAPWQLRTSTSDLSATMGDFDPLAGIDLRVRAQSAAGIFGEFSEDQEGYTPLSPAVDIDAADMTDLYTDGVGNIYAVWAGTLVSVAAPPRLAYVVAEFSSNGGSTYSAAPGPSIAAAGAIVFNPGAYGDYWVRLRGYDRLGNAGTASTAVEIVTTDPHVAPPIPIAPTGLASTPGAAWDASGFFPEAWFDLTWTAPTLDTLGNAISIVGYDVYGLRAGETVERFLTSVSTNAARIPVGNGDVWSFRVKATSNFGGISVFSTSITTTANATISAAAAPTAPVLAQYAGILQIQWAGGGAVPSMKNAYATISTTVGGTYTRAGGILTGAGEIDVPGLAPGTYYAKIVMVDELGQTSTSTAAGPITLLPITGVTIQTSAVANTGIKITTGGMTAYDASGNPTFILNAGTGEVWIAPYAAVFDLGASGVSATTGAAVTGLAIESLTGSFNTFFYSGGVQIRNDHTPLSWWEADASDASLVNFFSPRAVIGQRLLVGDFEFKKEAKSTGSRLVVRYKGA